MSKGYFLLDRDFFDHPIVGFKKPYTKSEAFIWLIANAAHSDTQHVVGSKVHVVERGSQFRTERELQQAWGWKRKTTIRNFLKTLTQSAIIRTTKEPGKTQIIIENYLKYQTVKRGSLKGEDQDRTTNETKRGPSEDQARTTKERIIKTLKELKEETRAGFLSNPCPDLVDGVTWEVWVQNDMIEAGLARTLDKNGWLSEGGEA